MCLHLSPRYSVRDTRNDEITLRTDDVDEAMLLATCGTHYDLLDARFPHLTDADCSVNPITQACVICDVFHGDPCACCKGRGYHNVGCCVESEAAL